MIRLFLALAFFATTLFSDSSILSKRFVPVAQTAATTGVVALWHNPAGLAFMGGTEGNLRYLYEWSELGNRHHGGVSFALNLWQHLTLALGMNTQAAITEKAKTNLGTDLTGIFGAALKITDYGSFGITWQKSHNFLERKPTPVLIAFGLQIRPFSFLSLGAHYEEVFEEYFAAPNITAGFAVRPYKEYFTLGFDNRFLAKSPSWQSGFDYHPVLSLKAQYRGYGAGISAEIPGMTEGFKRPIFSLLLDFNFSHLGFSVMSAINTAENNFAVGGHLRSSTEEWPSIRRHHGLWVELTIDNNGNIERQPATLAERLFSQPENPLSVLALLKRIENDPSIGHVVLNLNGFSFGDARTQEWRLAVEGIRNAGKEVIVYLDSPSERDYYIATAANKIHMNKYASLSLSNFQATLLYFGELLDKIGVKANAIAVGTYKTAPRMWTNARPQKEEIEIATNILNNFYETLLRDVEKARNIDHEKLKTLFDKGQITAVEAKDAGLIDELVSPVKDVKSEPRRTYFVGYENRVFKQDKWHPPKKVVVIPIINAITSSRVQPGVFSWLFSDTFAKYVVDEIEAAVLDDNVAGIIVRIDSPGGDADAGHRINQALMIAQKDKPVVTSMSDVAASAGMLVAAGTEHILAMPNTITGSIGVFSLMFSGEKLAEKIGVFAKELSTIKNPGPTLFRDMTKEERDEATKVTEWVYQNFLESISVGLDLDIEAVKNIADGRVWLGQEAFERKLVHEIGGFSQAVDSIRELADIPEDEELLVEVRAPGFRQEFSLTSALSAMLQSKSNDKKIISDLALPYLKAIEAYRINGVPQARLPFDIEWRRRY